MHLRFYFARHCKKVYYFIAGDFRHGTVRLDGESLSAKLVDLPCVIESLKTLDMKTFYKTADICQVLVFLFGRGRDSWNTALF